MVGGDKTGKANPMTSTTVLTEDKGIGVHGIGVRYSPARCCRHILGEQTLMTKRVNRRALLVGFFTAPFLVACGDNKKRKRRGSGGGGKSRR
ncbi:hypothetical protein SaccyDRAFT_2529 [Saccharomonospora cyanea NA-134]|uniref:Uncharacterized protein n=1 Tax=Saccharomonospora cyanea NA-134 TaxID=882082 RepID=H5XEC3_9PSEU|nr:hypothetical protein SaccyDRAFT_2529 [Saccharomonospora cyanea NA-134]